MENSARIRINLSSNEFEIEGTEQFVKEYYEKIETMLSALPSTTPPMPTPPETGGTPPPSGPDTGLPSTFGEYFHSFPNTITDVDRILIAGHYIESQSTDNLFTTEPANKLLVDQGIKLSNPSDCVSKNKRAKKVITISKGKFRVSPKGIAHINKLRSP